MIKRLLLVYILLGLCNAFAQNDTIAGEADYKKHYDCDFKEGKILIVQKKGRTIEYKRDTELTKNGFVIRMEAIYDLEFTDGKRYKTSIVKNITNDSITLTSTLNEKAAKYEGRKFELFTYAIKDLKTARFISDRSLGFYKKVNLKEYELFTKVVASAKLCPAVLTFPARNNEVKVCHYYLTSQGWNILFETNGLIDFLEYPVQWR